MGNWRTVGVRVTEEQLAVLNQKLAQLGYATLGELVGGLTEGVITNKQVVEELANTLADRVVNKMLTSQPVPADAAHALKSVRSTGFEPVLPAREREQTSLASVAPQALPTMPTMQQFSDWLEVVKQYNKTTTRGYVKLVDMALSKLPTFDYAHLLSYLKELRRNISPGYYSNHLGALKHYTRFIGKPELLAEFSHPPKQFVPKTFWTREQIVAFYNALTSLKMKALFLMGATTGLRKGEILSLRIDEIDHSTRMIMPRVHSGRTKHSWVSFYNPECEAVLREYMDSLSPVMRARGKLFPLSSRDLKVEWAEAKRCSGVPLKFKDLRDFFAESMLERGVQTIYIDAFAGRAPGSVLAKHYVDLSPSKLKQVYEQAGIAVLRDVVTQVIKS